jgi:hypothetical protein
MYALSAARSGIVCRERLRPLLSIVACVLFAACASGGAGSRAEVPELTRNVVIENHSWGPVTIYMSMGGPPMRLGDVDGMGRRTFSLNQFRAAMDAHDVYLVARPLAGQSFRSEAIPFFPGRTTVWTIENVSSLSQLVVR